MAAPSMTIGVIGGSTTSKENAAAAYEVGRLIARNGAVLVCGGLGGIMEAAGKGAHEAGGQVVGILPGEHKNEANPYVSLAIPTGMGIGRNMLVVRASDVLIAFPGSFGTLSEIALALNVGKPIVRMPGTWNLGKIATIDNSLFKEAMDPAHAVGLALAMVAQ
jgi:hypothetical protein